MNSKLKVLLGMNPFKFIWWNFLSNNVIRDKGKYLFPNWGAVIDISKSAKLILHAHLFLNNPKYKYSREEAYLMLRDDSILTINGSVKLASRSTIQVQRGGKIGYWKGIY